MKYLFVVIFVAVFILFDTDLGYICRSPLHTHFTYMFQHAGLVHLILNSLAFIAVFHSLSRLVNRWIIISVSLSCGFAASFLSTTNIPTVGASSMVYAMIGLYIATTLLNRKIKITDTRKYLLFISCVLIGLIVSALNPSSNFLVHVYSLVFGFVAAAPLSFKKL